MKKLVVAFLLIASTASAQLAPRGPGIRVVSPLDCEAVLACGGSEPFPTVCPDQDCAEPNNFMTWNADLGCFECGPSGTPICDGSVCVSGDYVVWNVDEACLECSGAPPSTELWSSGTFGIYHNAGGVVVGDGNLPWCSNDSGVALGAPGDLRANRLQITGSVSWYSGQNFNIVSCTADGDDDRWLTLSGGGAGSGARGASLELHGNEAPAGPGHDPGSADLIAGNVATGDINVLVTNAAAQFLLTAEAGGTDNTFQLDAAGATFGGNATDDVLIADPLNLYLNSSRAETICNTDFTMPSGSAFLSGQLGVEGRVFTDGDFTVGCGTTIYGDGSIIHDIGVDRTSLEFAPPSGTNTVSIPAASGTIVLDTTVAATQGALRSMASNVNQGAATISSVGHAGQTIQTPASGSANTSDSASGAFILFQTGATGTSWGGIVSDIPARRDWAPDATWRVGTGNDVTDIRLWVGSFSVDPHDSATPAGSYAGFRYDTAVDGTAFWRAVTDDGGVAPTVTPTVVAVTTGTFYTMRTVQSASAVDFYINEVLVASHSTNLPVATTVQAGYATVMELAGTLKRFQFGYSYARMN